jgi:hypothetical protein
MASRHRAGIPDAAPTRGSSRLTAAEQGATGVIPCRSQALEWNIAGSMNVSGIRLGCARARVEITSWKDAPVATLERIRSELPKLRSRLGIGLHRLSWIWDTIHTFKLKIFGSWNCCVACTLGTAHRDWPRR